jgi:hypothetical protein
MATGRLCVLAFGIGGLLLASDDVVQKIPFPAGGVVHIVARRGDFAVEGWDQREVEVTAAKSTTALAAHGNEVLITAHRGGSLYDYYKVRVPRDARLMVEDKEGELHVVGLEADIRAKLGRGEIVLLLAPEGRYAIDARSTLGGVVSDFPGKSRRDALVFGHSFAVGASSPAHSLYLRTRFGDILVLKNEKPAVRPMSAAAARAQ